LIHILLGYTALFVTFTFPNKIFWSQSASILNFVAMMIKRQRENEEKESIDLANSLVLLSKPFNKSYAPVEFECKTCKRKFSSFQALGGHRASHKKPKLNGEDLRSEA
ncbi:C2H2-type zinc finger protein, partial [Escherichia coli]|nr:C2H2-type zinc finger protein [Escherichia coli]